MSCERTSVEGRSKLGVLIDLCLANDQMTRLRMICEKIDNSLDARARNIRFSRNDERAEIRDDGIGCADLRLILTPSMTRGNGGPRSGRFGIGGKLASMQMSRGHLTEVQSVHEGIVRQMSVHWAENRDRYTWDFRESPPSPARDGQAGTVIRDSSPDGPLTIREPAKIAERIGFLYADAIKAGVAITLVIDGRRHDIKPYSPPRFVRQVEFEVDYKGFKIAGFCGLVMPGEPNPHQGWTFHWGPCRSLLTTTEPADTKYCGLVHGHVFLPPGWDDVNVTKDNFLSDDILTLYEMIGDKCRPIIDAAQEASEDHELRTFNRDVESLLNGIIPVPANGRRPGMTGQEGTVEPKDSGRKHRKFNIWKPGDRGVARSAPAVPQRFELRWSDTIENAWEVQISGKRNTVGHITLNHSRPIIGELRKRQDAFSTYAFCIPVLCGHLGINTDLQQAFNFHDEGQVSEIFDQLTDRGRLPESKK